MLISKVSQVSIPVSDQDRSIEFFTKKLGFTLEGDWPYGEGQRWIELAIPGAETRLVLHKDPGATPGGFSPIMFSSPNIEQTAKELVERDVELAQPLTTEEWGTFVMFKDPDGNTFLVAGAPAQQ